MIDTIALLLPQNKFTILDHERFSPSSKGLFSEPYYKLGSRGYIQCVQNSTPSEIKAGIYKPRLTMIKRAIRGGLNISLRIELSLPKLCFGNNFQELHENDFDNIILKLKDSLKSMGILIFEHNLINAPVCSIHYSKNILLSRHITSSMIIREISTADINQNKDISQRDFRNGGQIIHIHTNNMDVAIYDKVKDLQQAKKSEKRAFENDSYLQLNLFDQIAPQLIPEVTRIEARINNITKLKALLKKLNISVEPTFTNLFNESVSQTILLSVWDELYSGLKLQSIDTKQPEQILAYLLKENSNLTPQKALAFTALILLANNAGITQTRDILKPYYSTRTWQRMKSELTKIKLPTGSRYQAVSEIQTALEAFQPIKEADVILKQLV